MKPATFLLGLMWTSAAPMLVCQETKAVEQKKAAALTEEEREIVKDREVLEYLELLQSLDKIQYLDLFSEQEHPKEKGPAAPAKNKTERKK